MTKNELFAGYLNAPNSCHQSTPPDPQHGIDEEWCASIVDEETGDIVAHAFAPTGDEAMLRARQLSAAPELLEALIEFSDHYGEDFESAIDDGLDAILVGARAAIEKATN